MVVPSAGSVVLVPFPFSDLSQSKLRPAVVLADAGRGDWTTRYSTACLTRWSAFSARRANSASCRLIHHSSALIPHPSSLKKSTVGRFLCCSAALRGPKIKIRQPSAAIVTYMLPYPLSWGSASAVSANGPAANVHNRTLAWSALLRGEQGLQTVKSGRPFVVGLQPI